MDFEQYKKGIKALAEEYKLLFVVLFGSQARGAVHPKSDIDIAVSFENPDDPEIFHKQLELSSELALMFKRDDVEVVNVDNINVALIAAIARDGKLLYEKYPNVFFNWQVFAFGYHMETEWMRNARDKMLREWALKIESV